MTIYKSSNYMSKKIYNLYNIAIGNENGNTPFLAILVGADLLSVRYVTIRTRHGEA